MRSSAKRNEGEAVPQARLVGVEAIRIVPPRLIPDVGQQVG
jgi:hypothetical protein